MQNVRRSDYITSLIYKKTKGAIDFNYFHETMCFINKKMPDAFFYVFSDNIDWCKRILNKHSNCVFVDHSHAGKKITNYLHNDEL